MGTKGVGGYVLEMFLTGLMFMALIGWIEFRKLRPPKAKESSPAADTHTNAAGASVVNPLDEASDPDLVAEIDRASAPNAAQANVVTIKNLRKVYQNKTKGEPDKVAVHNLCLNVAPGTCFGLLGPNGAGKTTTMSMLTGTAWPTSGTASIAGQNIHSGVEQVYKRLGFCPQYHGIFPTMTIDEHLEFYGGLKGMPASDVAAFAGALTAALDMTEHRGKRSSQLSGGNKRKLSLAIAMMGAPEVLILDEPSAGVDPAARASMVDIIHSVRRQRGGDSCVVITTHLMEEVEALCDRVAIMAHGRLRAVGSLPHIKSRFGGFWQVFVKFHQSDGNHAALKTFMTSLHPEASMLENHQQSSTWRVPKSDGLKLAKAFRRLEGAKAKLGIEEYSVSQCSLEQIFIKFAKDSEAEAAVAAEARAKAPKA
jgi:ATP-binding cassette subfamily A (ABC1) protein 3